MKVLLFTHEQDIDGMGNVILCKKAFADFDYVTCKTFEVNKNVKEKIDDGSIYDYDYIFVTDICIKEPLLKEIDNDSRLKNKIIILDHHKSEIEEGNDKYEWVNIIVEKNGSKCSGTSLFYEYLREKGYLEYNKTIEEMVDLTRQYDTGEWKEKYNNYKARKLHILFEVLGYENYIKIMNRIVENDNGIVFSDDEREIIEKFDKDFEKEINDIIDGMKIYELTINNVNYRIGYVRCFYKYRNDINEMVMKDNKRDIDLVGMIMLDTETVSYRLVKDVDASVVAVYFGGKGHKAASSNPQDNPKFKEVMDMFIDEESEDED